jgi:hypothetical protein
LKTFFVIIVVWTLLMGFVLRPTLIRDDRYRGAGGQKILFHSRFIDPFVLSMHEEKEVHLHSRKTGKEGYMHLRGAG